MCIYIRGSEVDSQTYFKTYGDLLKFTGRNSNNITNILIAKVYLDKTCLIYRESTVQLYI